ncbi:MAG: succinate dehydrogenase assembly factor 2 [Gammaproteobacteria bacterium]|nr:succinate dehydrogenase assembly factor 2 [Gammaproteobacteria bacterium]
MAESSSITAGAKSRLYWRCRRGMLELDLLLQGFVHNGYDALTDTEKHDFERLLDTADQELLELLLEQQETEDPALANVITKIRSAA